MFEYFSRSRACDDDCGREEITKIPQHPCLNTPGLCQCCCSGQPGPQGATGEPGRSAYEIALYNGFVGTEQEWLDSLKGEPGPPAPFLSSYMEVLGNNQTVPAGANIVFDAGAADSVGNNIVLDPSGTTFTITRTGLYHVEWSLNLAPESNSAVVGIIENGEGASGASCSAAGSFSSGTLIYVDTVPFTLSLHNYGNAINIENPPQWLDSAASIRIVRFADGPSV